MGEFGASLAKHMRDLYRCKIPTTLINSHSFFNEQLKLFGTVAKLGLIEDLKQMPNIKLNNGARATRTPGNPNKQSIQTVVLVYQTKLSTLRT